MKRTNIFRGVVCVGLAVLGLMWLTTVRKWGKGGIGDALAFPEEAAIVVGLNVGEVREAVRDLVEGDGSIDGRLAALVKDCGFDPVDDVEFVVAAFPAEQRGNATDFAALLNGRFKRLMACADSQAKAGKGVRESRIGRHTVYGLGEGGPEVTCVDSTTCITGSSAWVAKMLDLLDGKPGVRGINRNPEMVRLLEETKRDSDVWWAGTIPQALQEQLKIATENTLLSSVRNTHGWLKLNNGLEGRIHIGAGDEAEARQIAGEAAAALATLMVDKEAQEWSLAEDLRHVKVSSTDSQCVFDVELNTQQAERLRSGISAMQAAEQASVDGKGLGAAGDGLERPQFRQRSR